ncbi:cytoskeleton-associated protein 5-like isoform X3 [Anneissia japonica]|uniref:cytoskeleton-associated protein 5-like isoform X3 n=1 Tax=Anneissia japonica TaxID=1529436 RepID=UPI001425576F|nr:cytoskeleton-associated protein 5-like isoform X3 [Anneissia japonica]
MGDESEWLKLPLDDRCVHKVWKARLHGYTEAIKYFGTLDSKSPEFTKYLGIIKKFVVDTNAVAQEKGLDATLAFLENAASAHKTCAEVSAGVVTKCLNSSRTKTKEKGIEILMVCIELEKQEIVIEEVMKGLTNKQPKIVAASILVLRTAISNFGSKIITLKPIVKVMPKLFEHSDKNVREEAKLLAIEIYRWIGAVFKPGLQKIKPVQMKELEEEFEKLPNKAPKQIRFLKSQQELKEKFEEAAAGGGESEDDDEDDVRPEVDPFELLPAVDVLSKLPKDFFENIEAKKWQTRKEALDNLLPLATSPKIEGGDFAELVRVLKKVVSKDTNVMIVTVAGKCLGGLAIGLRKKFTPYAVACTGAILEKFKEKKVTVVSVLRDAIDAIFLTTTLQNISEDVLVALDNKNPSIRAETAAFLARAMRHCTLTTLPKSLLKPLSAALVKKIGDTSPEVREAVAESLGTAMKVVGEKHLLPFIADLDKIKQDKIREWCEKTELATGGGKKKKEKSSETKAAPTKAAPGPSKAAAKPASAAKSKARPASASGAGKASKGKKKPKQSEETEKKSEPAYSPEDVDEKAAVALPATLLQQLGHANWKERLAGMEELTTKIHNMEKKDIDCQLYVRLMAKKPGYKDANFQVLKAKFALIGILAEKGKFSRTSGSVCIGGIVEKIGDIKQSATAKETMTSISEACSLQFVALEAVSYAFDTQKNPKNQSETLNWFAQAIQEFGFASLKVKCYISYIKKALGATNPAIRTAAITTVGTMYMYMGAPLRMLFEDEKPALLAQIDAEFQKVSGTSPPAPFRGIKKEEKRDDADGDDVEDDVDEEESEVGGSPSSIQDLVPRVDISDQITSSLIEELGDSKWKVRGQGLDRVQTILNSNKFITPNLGELPTALKPRLSDTNKILATNTANICTQLAQAIGPAIKVHVRTLVPGLLMLNCDSKPTVRAASVSALSAWEEQVGLAPFIEDELLNTVLAKESPFLRMEVFGWLEEKLAKYHTLPSDLALTVPILYTALEDRNPEVRKKAQGVLPLFMMHLSYEKCVKMTNKLKPSSKTQVMQILEKQRPNIPAKPGKPEKTKKAKTAAPPPQEEKKRPKTAPPKTESSSSTDTSPTETATTTTTRKKPVGKSKAEPSSQPEPIATASPTASVTTKKSKLVKGKTSKSSKSKQEDEDVGPPVILNNLKDRRFRDEDNLKVLKWNFSVPRDEIIDQLKEQIQPCVSPSLFTALFHADFKYHITALTTLKEAVTSHKEACIGALDVLLKWVTLRFFDTNTSVNIKALEFLQVLFNMLAEEDYSMHDYEASAFLPYLVLKIGENKENIRKMVRSCIKTITKIYPASKVFQFIIDGLKSKNARQRTECLEELGNLIDLYGINVCQPSPPKALKDIAVQISDRDNSVRSAALNTLVQAYAIVGEGIYKMVGRLNEKDVSLLEERIKRSSKKVKSAPPMQEPKQTKQDAKKSMLPAPSNGTDRPSTAPPQSGGNIRSSNVPQVFKLDLDGLGLNDGDSNDNIPQLEDMDHVQDLLSDAVKLPQRRLQKPSLTVAQLDFIISQIASNDIAISLQSLKQLDEALQDSDRSKVLTDHIDQLVVTTSLQLRMAFSKYMSDETTSKDVIRMYRCLVALLMSLFQNRMLAMKASKDVLCDLVNGLITVLIDNRLEAFDDGPQVIRSINMLMVKVLDQSDPTNSMCALLKLLQEYVAHESSSPKFVQLIMKCLWRMVRSMPEIIHDINVERLLLSLHLFLKAFPSSVWKERTNDTPLRTIKTILHSLAKILGSKVLSYLVLINDKNSEVELYLKKIVRNNRKSVGGDHINGSVQETSNSSSTGNVASPRRGTARTNDILAEIFKRIGSKENTREGLAELYDFKCKYPDVDIEPFLKKTSPFFQSYIERGLKNIATEREKAQTEKQNKGRSVGSTDSISSVDSVGNLSAGQDVSTSQLRDRLKVLRARCGLDNGSEAVQDPVPVKSSSRPELVTSSSIESDSGHNAMPHLYQPQRITLGSSTSSAPTPAQVPDTNVDELRKRLERIKKGGSMK